jgi:hypothetical protein
VQAGIGCIVGDLRNIGNMSHSGHLGPPEDVAQPLLAVRFFQN